MPLLNQAPFLGGDDFLGSARERIFLFVGATAFGLSSFPYFVAVDDQGSVAARAAGEITTDQFADLVAAAQGR